MNARRLAPLTLMLSALACAGGAERDRDPGITDADGGVSSGQDSGQSDAGAGVDAGPNPSGDVGRYQVHEITVSASNDGFRNVWEDAQLQARLTAPSGAMVTVPGFYYDANTWKIRYAPSEVGAYTYSYTLSGPAGTVSEGSGRFVVYESSEQGFLRQHSSNPYRMVFERTGALFTGQGFSGCLRDPESQTFPTPWEDKGFCIDKYRATDADACGKTYDQYMNVYADQMKPAVYRWNVNACSFPLWNQIDTTFPNGVATPNNYYNVTWGKWGDKVVRDLRRRGIRILMSPVGFGWQRAPYGNRCGPNNDQDCTTSVCGEHADMPCTAHNAAVVDTNDVQGLMRYYTYIVARYGAYVDIWELINEFPLPDAAITQLSNHLRSVDPYGHPITISWTRPDHPSMELSVPHVYQRSDANDIDLRQADALVAGNLGVDRVYPKARYPMPIIAGEIGEPFGTSSDANFELNMRVGSRIKLWSAFFNEAGLVLWESSLNNAQANGGVTFLSPELRQAFAVHQTFAAAMTADVVPVAMSTLQSGSDRVRVYQLKGASTLYGYLLHPNSNVTSPTTARGFTVQLDVPRAGTLRWISPADGAERGSSAVQAGLQSVAVPEFDFDLAFSLTP